jgi:RNA polymerase sigma factor (sigma-70 family)
VIKPELIKHCKNGDQKSQKQLFDIYSDRFFRSAVRYVKDTSEAEDVIMLTFVKIFEGLKKFTYQEPKSFESWMYKILVNEALMALRRRHNFFLTERWILKSRNMSLRFFRKLMQATCTN